MLLGRADGEHDPVVSTQVGLELHPVEVADPHRDARTLAPKPSPRLRRRPPLDPVLRYYRYSVVAPPRRHSRRRRYGRLLVSGRRRHGAAGAAVAGVAAAAAGSALMAARLERRCGFRLAADPARFPLCRRWRLVGGRCGPVRRLRRQLSGLSGAVQLLADELDDDLADELGDRGRAARRGRAPRASARARPRHESTLWYGVDSRVDDPRGWIVPRRR
jgi:hypothetical protein